MLNGERERVFSCRALTPSFGGSSGGEAMEPDLDMKNRIWVLRGLRMPVLSVLAEKDVQIVAAQNEPALRAALRANPEARVVTLLGLNHLFQTAKTGAPTEYRQIEETIAPLALQTIGDWLVETLCVLRKN